jgi:hypothetical protein
VTGGQEMLTSPNQLIPPLLFPDILFTLFSDLYFLHDSCDQQLLFVISAILRNTFTVIWWHPVNVYGKKNPDIIYPRKKNVKPFRLEIR